MSNDNAMRGVTELSDLIGELYEADAIHVKRGLKIRDCQTVQLTNHLLEEMTELQAAVMEDNGSDESLDAVEEEAADVLLIFLHVMRKKGIGLPLLCEVARDKLSRSWTTNPANVTAVKPGFSRRGRKDNA